MEVYSNEAEFSWFSIKRNRSWLCRYSSRLKLWTRLSMDWWIKMEQMWYWLQYTIWYWSEVNESECCYNSVKYIGIIRRNGKSEAENIILKLYQKRYFLEEISTLSKTIESKSLVKKSSSIYSLYPVLNDKGLLCVGKDLHLMSFVFILFYFQKKGI